MKQIFSSFIFFYILIAAPYSVKSDILDSSKNIKEVIILHNDTSMNAAKEIEYKLLYENQSEYNSKILSTIYWALSSILVVVLAIIGSNLFLNFRFNKKQYDELIRKYELRIGNMEGKLLEDITNNSKLAEEKMNESNTKTKEEIINLHNENIKEIKSVYSERLNSYSENLKGQISSIKENYDNIQEVNNEKYNNMNNLIMDTKNYFDSIQKMNNEKLESINNLIAENKENVKIETQKILNEINSNIEKKYNYLKVDINGLEAEIWKSKGIYSNALLGYVRQSIVSIEVGWIFMLRYSLENIISMFDKVKSLSRYDFELFDKLIPLIPEEYSINKSKIIALVDSYKEKK